VTDQIGSHLSGDNLPFIEELYGQYLDDPDSVDPSWIPVFEEYFGEANGRNGSIRPHFRPRSLFSPPSVAGPVGGYTEAEYAELASQGFTVRTPEKSTKFAARVRALVRAYRLHGHLTAQIDPLGRPHAGEPPPELDPARYGITETDMDTPVLCEALFGNEEVSLRRVMERLQALYCDHIGIEFQNIPDNVPRQWLRRQIEVNEYAPIAGSEERIRILRHLVDADAFESFLHKKYVGAKRFSLSGGDSLIPLLHSMLHEGGRLGLEEVIIGMAHRGRLNVLHNIMGKPARSMLSEFEKNPAPEDFFGSSDVKYHMGYSSDYQVENGRKIHLSLCFNPSHLEYVNPVVVGRTKAKQERCGKEQCKRKLAPLLLHGDAAFSGQGIVAETLQMARLRGYDVGGTIHVVINNQIGFTATPDEQRSTMYATDIAKILEVPIFHVNGHDPEACVRVAKLAMRYRQKFQQDVVIDLVCYREYGHNEGDEPRFTQPVMYQAIEDVGLVRENYAEKLRSEGVIEDGRVDEMWDKRMRLYGEVFEEVRDMPEKPSISSLDGVWNSYKGGDVRTVNVIDTSVPLDRLQALGEAISTIPDDVDAHRTIKRLFRNRAKMAAGEDPIDWGFAESLALASLVAEGSRVRVSGQDSIRGTFNHRHSAVVDSKTGERYWPIRHVEGAGEFDVYNSFLSEAGVLGFEYGFSLDYPDALTVWEAQFGDFANGAQVIIDQFISSGEDKWERLSGLVMLLPHGYEGQGPEHSSARLERYLQLSAEHNWFVCNLTLPSQIFHVLRRQIHNPVRKPLIIMTPKSLLRHKRAISSLEDLASGGFQHVIGETRELDPSGVERVLLCSGKVYYDLLDYAEEHEREDVAIIRVEQLYPLAEDALAEAVAPYENARQFWVQEEPKNMGPWSYILRSMHELFGEIPTYVGRAASASPATGFKEAHEMEQAKLIREAFGDDESE
jgi:2-oxoglutarate dehydrogenase E1 component